MRSKFDPRRALSSATLYSFFTKMIVPNPWQHDYVRDVMQASPGDRILDIGCGTADILQFLPDVDYTGFDGSEKYIQKAKSRYGHRGTFICQEITPDIIGSFEGFDIVIGLGVLHHLTDADAEVLFRTAKRALKPSGRLTTFDGAYTDHQSIIAKRLLDMDRGNYVRRPEAYEALATEQFNDVNVDIRTDILRLPYTHCIMICKS